MKDGFNDFKEEKHSTEQGERWHCVYVHFCACVCVRVCDDHARELESENHRQCEVGKRCFRKRELAYGCVPLYPLLIHSLLSQSLGNETGDRNGGLQGVGGAGGPLYSIHFLCSFHLSLSISSSPPHHLCVSVALDHFKMSGPLSQLAETKEKYHHSYLGLQTMNPNCSWDGELPRADCVVCHWKENLPFIKIWKK